MPSRPSPLSRGCQRQRDAAGDRSPVDQHGPSPDRSRPDGRRIIGSSSDASSSEDLPCRSSAFENHRCAQARNGDCIREEHASLREPQPRECRFARDKREPHPLDRCAERSTSQDSCAIDSRMRTVERVQPSRRICFARSRDNPHCSAVHRRARGPPERRHRCRRPAVPATPKGNGRPSRTSTRTRTVTGVVVWAARPPALHRPRDATRRCRACSSRASPASRAGPAPGPDR